MPETLSAIQAGRLERSCGPRGDSIRLGAGADGIERVEAFFGGRAFEPHRHDTYAIGITTGGVQRFRYRGADRRCLPGQLHFLHPDEIHDGRAGTDAGFGYRILYVAPSLVQEALHGRSLPFVAEPVQRPSPQTAGLAVLLRDMDEPMDELARAVAAAAVADALAGAGSAGKPAGAIDLTAVAAVREYLDAHPTAGTRAHLLERIAGIDRWTIARHFRAAFGTSPDRYRTMRRLAVARRAIAAGTPLAEAAAAAGFADQSHMTRQFTRAYGMTPGRWARATRSAGVTASTGSSSSR
ncbi:MAG TPA: AraC family transcriptional regulator [Gaiellales bacterium]